MEHGAIGYYECSADDMKAPFGCQPLSKMAKAKPNETAIFAWIVFKSKADRNKVNAKVMKDKRIAGSAMSCPFDPKRMGYGGFKVLVNA